jgi:hypothetical protein
MTADERTALHDALDVLCRARAAAFDALLDDRAAVGRYVYLGAPEPPVSFVDVLYAWKTASNAIAHIERELFRR